MNNKNVSSKGSYNDEFNERKNKLKELKDIGVLPYAQRFDRTHTVFNLKKNYEKKKPRDLESIISKPNCNIRICGRLMLIRSHGKLTFAKIKDFSGEIQICFMKDFTDKDVISYLKKIDIGDFIGVEGEVFITRHGELTLLIQNYELLSKTLRPLPEKFHGLQNREAQYRYRYLDLLKNEDSYKRFIFRTKLTTAIRKYMDSHEFIEIETPILQPIASGATAKPFTTHHNALDLDVFLRIAPETYLKRAICGGFDRVYEISKCFRNEGMDPSHLQEFTMLEYYASYWSFEDNMDFTEQFLSTVIKETTGSLQVKVLDRDGKENLVDFTPPWPRVEFVKLIKDDCGINILDFYGDADALRKEIEKTAKNNTDENSLNLMSLIKDKSYKGLGYGNLCDALYKKVSRPKLIQPMFVIKHPVDTKPLARRSDVDPRLADTFQVLVNTWEIVNAYGELVDPVDQRERLISQSSARESGDEEAMMMDEDYLFAIEHGMPPMSGWGLGIDRFVALLTERDNLKDTVLFPLMKPEKKISDKITGVGVNKKK